jgi:alpha-beta hydrolase superfamily lysophospholipase
MYPFLLDLHRVGRDSGLAALQLRYRVRGYNEGDPVADLEWALSEIARRHGNVPVCMVGHSMGARSVLRCAGHESVRAVVALAPWLPPGEPTAQLAGRTVVMAHGTRDRTTSPARSLA